MRGNNGHQALGNIVCWKQSWCPRLCIQRPFNIFSFRSWWKLMTEIISITSASVKYYSLQLEQFCMWLIKIYSILQSKDILIQTKIFYTERIVKNRLNSFKNHFKHLYYEGKQTSNIKGPHWIHFFIFSR